MEISGWLVPLLVVVAVVCEIGSWLRSGIGCLIIVIIVALIAFLLFDLPIHFAFGVG